MHGDRRGGRSLDLRGAVVDTGAVKPRKIASKAPQHVEKPPHAEKKGTSGARGEQRPGGPAATAPRAAPEPELEAPEVAERDGHEEELAAGPDLTPVVAKNLKRLRTERGLSLERLSQAAGVSRAMLGQIEQAKSAPTINVVWKIVRALDVPFSTLITDPGAGRVTIIPAARARMLRSRDGTFSSRALFPMDQPRNVEFYELRLAPFGIEEADPHPTGTTENLVVANGSLEITVGAERALLVQGDAILFQADVPHMYRNPGNAEAVLYLVMTYPRQG